MQPAEKRAVSALQQIQTIKRQKLQKRKEKHLAQLEKHVCTYLISKYSLMLSRKKRLSEKNKAGKTHNEINAKDNMLLKECWTSRND